MSPKRLLVYCPSDDQLRELERALRWVCGDHAAGDGEPAPLSWDGLELHLVRHTEIEPLLDDVARSYVNLIVLDLRTPAGASDEEQAVGERTRRLLTALDRVDDVEDRYAFHRILALVGGPATAASDELVRELGSLGAGHVLRHVGWGAAEPDLPGFAAELLRHLARTLRDRRPGKLALCCAGGGTTGIFFELGTLKALDDCLGGDGLAAFDMLFGISAGAVVTGPLAVGYSVDEFMAAIAGVPGGRIPPLDLRLFRIGHLDVSGFARRARIALATAWRGLRSMVRTNAMRATSEQLLFDYADLVAPPFRADRFERVLREVLEAPGGTNDFRRLPRELYIGATDQDQRRHVLFGDEEHDAVPISQAIQASLSINPAFSATRINGRYYEDGAVTRTSNFVEAIRRGANLIFVVDPFLPYVARTPGFNDQRGVLYNIDQDIRTISYTRYETTRNWVLRKHPQISAFTFVPANRLRRLISNNPMDHRPYLEIWRGAYLSTLSRLRHVEHRLAGNLAAHGLRLCLDRAAAVAERLTAAETVTLADFFPDGKLALRRPPLVGDRERRRAPPPRPMGAVGV